MAGNRETGMLDPERPQDQDVMPPAAAAVADAPLQLGATLSRALPFYGRHLPVLAALTAVVFLPLVLCQLDFGERVAEGATRNALAASAALLGGLHVLLPLLLQLFLTFAVFQHLRGDRPRLARSILRGVVFLVPAVGLALLFLLIVSAVVFAVGIPVRLLVRPEDSSEVLRGAGTIATVLSVAWLFAIYFVAPQALVVEGLAPWTALGRSATLTRGSRWRIFALLVFLVVLLWLAGQVLDLVLPAGPWSREQWRLAVVLRLGLAALLCTLAAVCAAVVYHDRRLAKDGVPVEDLLRVFE